MTFSNGSFIPAVWLNAVDKAAYDDGPAALSDLTVSRANVDAVLVPGWAQNSNFSNTIDWAKISNLPSSLSGYGITDGGTLLNVRLFTTADSGSAYVPTPGTGKVVVEVQAGGAAGGASYGGISGSYAYGVFTSNVAGTIMTIGAGGVYSGSGYNAGGTSSFGTFISCPSSAGNSSNNGSPATALPTGIYQRAQRGAYGEMGFTATTLRGMSSEGASTKFGAGGVGSIYINSVVVSPPIPPVGYGAGGGAGSSPTNGAPGVIVIWEYI